MKFVERLDSFLRTEVNLDQGRIDDMEARVQGISNFLNDHEIFGEMLCDMVPAGSRAHRTIIKPVDASRGFDADVLVLVTRQATWLPTDYCQKLYEALRSSDEYRERAHRKTRCVRVEYKPDFHVDLVPYLEIDGNYYITNRTDPPSVGSFEPSNPEQFNEWLVARQEATNRNFVKVIRLLKYLRDFKTTFTCKSIILTTLLGECVAPATDEIDTAGFMDVPTTLVTLMTRLSESLPEAYPQIFDPGGTGDDFAERYSDTWNYSNFKTVIAAYAAKMQAAYDESDRDTSLALWCDLLGDGFGRPTQKLTKMAEAYRAAEPHTGEQFIDHAPFGYSIALDPKCSVKIIARAEDALIGGLKFRHGFRQFDLPRAGGRAPKFRSLKFRANARCIPPYRLFWKVRNGGIEAAAAGQLRGEITEDDGSRSKQETTKYAGKHYVECYLVKDGVVVAKARHDVVIP